MRITRSITTSSLLCLLAFGAASGQQQADAAALARADSAFQQNQWQTAADRYRAIVRDDASNAMAWFRLASSLEQLGRSDDAVAAYTHAAQLEFQPALVQYRIARVLARKGDTRGALEHLRTAATLGAPPAQLESEPAFAPLRAMAEFADIRKKAEEVRYPCRAVHTFDFWVGTFDAAPWNTPDAPPSGELDNTREYDGCVIVERWVSKLGQKGMSMSFYDANRHVWRMIWNDDANASNDFEGEYKDGAMRFQGWVLDAKGNRVLALNVLQNVSPGVIRHIYSTSSDGGKTWVVLSDGRFTRRAQG